MKKILITGSLGLVGIEAVKFFKEKGFDVYGIDNNSRAKFFEVTDMNHEDDVTRHLDIRDEEEINASFQRNKFDVIIHTAAQPSHD